MFIRSASRVPGTEVNMVLFLWRFTVWFSNRDTDQSLALPYRVFKEGKIPQSSATVKTASGWGEAWGKPGIP